MRPAVNPARWLSTERLIAVQPDPKDAASAGWRRRMRAFPGRSLSHLALTAEQDQRGGRLALRGQMRSPGVAAGLEVDFDRSERQTLRIAPGFGVAATGEDVSLTRELDVAARDLLVWGTRNPIDPGSVDLTLGELPARPRALALVLQPVEILAREDGDPDSPCENDPEADAFADHQRVDGAMPVWVELPRSLAEIARDAADPTMRNRLAHAIFELEVDAARRDADVRAGAALALPWEAVGVPAALVGFDEEGLVRFVDRHAVVRRGGKARPRSGLLLQEGPRGLWTGTPALWQARIDQLGEHLLDLLVANRSAPGLVYRSFVVAPPVGVLPLDLVRSLPEPTRSQQFFPPHVTVEWAPVPVEQLDAALMPSASLARLDFSRRFLVRMLVPVPEAVFEPRLLVAEAPNQELQEKKIELDRALGQKRRIRDALLEQRRALEGAIGGPAAQTPMPDEPDEPDPGDLPTTVPPILDVDAEIAAFTGEALRLGGNSAAAIVRRELRTGGVRGARQALARLADKADDTIDFGFLRAQADIYRTRQILLGNEKASQLAVSPALAGMVQGSTAFASMTALDAIFAKTERSRTPPAPAAPSPSAPSAPVGTVTVTRLPITELRAVLAQPLRAPLAVAAAQPPAIASEAPFPIDDRLKDEVKSPLPYEAPLVERTVSIAERLPDAPSKQARASAKASKYTTLETITRLKELDLDDVLVTVPEVDDGQPTGRTRRVPLPSVAERLAELSAHEADADTPGDGALPLADEARVLSVGVRLLDDTIGVLRQIEVKAANLRSLLKLADALIVKLQGELGLVVTRLVTAGKELSEARHDHAVVLALIAEDAAQVDATNARRRQVLLDHARFVAFVRPRTEDLIDDVPGRDLESPEEMPVPACFREELGAVPPEIRQAVDLVRRAPLHWLPPYHALLDALDDRATLTHMVQATVQLAPLTMVAEAKTRVSAAAVPLVQGLRAGYAAMEAQLAERDEALRAFDVGQADKLAWSALRAQAVRFVSFADFVHVGHLRPDVLSAAGVAIDRMARVATCLYRRFAETPPDIRLAWAQRLSVFDTAIGLRDLMALPRFHELPQADRGEMQALVDWLFSQVAPLPRPRVMMDNLVRVCALLASHAPVRGLLRGAIPRTTVSVGDIVRIRDLDVIRTRVGMNVLVGKAGLARAVVEDVTEGYATARIVSTTRPSVDLPDNTEAFLGEPEQFNIAAAKVLASARS